MDTPRPHTTAPPLTVREAAERLRLHRQTVEKLIRDGDLDARKIGRQWRIPAAAVARLLEADR